jgi:hypothetical protein
VLTVFSVPKAFVPPFDRIQENAVESWKAIGARVLLLGDETGVAECAARVGVEHVPELARNEHGTPILSDAFAQAEDLSSDPLLVYVNGDVMLPPALTFAADAVRRACVAFLLVGRCADVEPPAAPDLGTGWAERLADGAPFRGHDYLDWFVFTRGLFAGIPPFAVGRAGFDNWLVWKARASGAPVVDATAAVLPLHQHHDHSHVPGGVDWAYSGPEAKMNVELAGGQQRMYTLLDATHRLDRGFRLHRNLTSRLRLSHRVQQARLLRGRARRRLLP